MHHRRYVRVLATLTLVTLLVGGCRTSRRGTGDMAPRPAAVNHFVLFKLNDPAESDQLIADCEALLAPMPDVISYFAGAHVDVGRGSPTIVTDYDVALYVGFADEAAYTRYVDHPNHVELVDRWRPKFAWLKVHDVYDAGFTRSP